MLYLEAMGSIRLPAVEKAGSGTPIGMEYGQVGTRPVAFEWDPALGYALPTKYFAAMGIPELVVR